MDSKIKITTYVDAEKIHEESHIGTYIDQSDSEKLKQLTAEVDELNNSWLEIEEELESINE